MKLPRIAVCAALVLCFAAFAEAADAGPLKPPRGKVFFGVTDTGDAEGFRSFAESIGKHPAVIQTYHPWGNSLSQALPRWQSVRARPILHISTADGDGREVVTPRGIALGKGDDYLLRINRNFARRKLRAYIRPLGEPNRCLNPYAAVDCAGNARPSRYLPVWHRKAFRRMYLLLRGGRTRRAVNRELRRLGLPRLRRSGGREPRYLPRAPVALIWSPLPAGSPTTKLNRPGRFYPGDRYTDWVATDFYSRYPHWKDLKRFYTRYSKRRRKPFALTEWGVWGADDPRFVRRLFRFFDHRPRARMLVYYQDFGSVNEFRIQNYPTSLTILAHRLRSPRFPGLAPNPPTPPIRTGGVGSGARRN